MRYEKIIKRPNGAAVKISVSIALPFLQEQSAIYSVWCSYRGPGKRKWVGMPLNEAATPEEVKEAKLELWNKLKPE